MKWTLIIGGLFLIPMAIRAWFGFAKGAVAETRQALTQIFAVLFAMRYWHLSSELFAGLVTYDPRYVAAVSLVGLYVLGAVIAGLVFRIKLPTFKGVKRDLANQTLGIVMGLVSGSMMGGILVCLALLFVPPSERTEISIPERIVDWAPSIARAMETHAAQIPATDETRTRFPEVGESLVWR